MSPIKVEMPQGERSNDVEKFLKDQRIAYREASDELTKLEQALGEGDTRATEERSDPNDEIAAARKKKQTALDLVNNYLHWQRNDQGDNGYSVSGGLVIPFYLVVLSLIGGAISLTRRIPEYQKQAASGYVGTPDAPSLTLPMLREYLVFQIVQFISAPFIAAVAYYMLEPTTTSATVGLAFAAGFASETILLWLRAMVDKIKPDSHVEEETGSLVGALAGQSGASAVEIENTYSISIVGISGLPPVFFDGGQFVINGVPKGACALEVIRLAPPGDVPLTICRRVMIDAGKPTPVSIDLA